MIRDCILQVPVRERGLFKAQLEKEFEKHNLPLLGVLPFNPLIYSVRMDEIQASLNVDMISGRKQQADHPVNQVTLAETCSWIMHCNTKCSRTNFNLCEY